MAHFGLILGMEEHALKTPILQDWEFILAKVFHLDPNATIDG